MRCVRPLPALTLLALFSTCSPHAVCDEASAAVRLGDAVRTTESRLRGAGVITRVLPADSGPAFAQLGIEWSGGLQLWLARAASGRIAAEYRDAQGHTIFRRAAGANSVLMEYPSGDRIRVDLDPFLRVTFTLAFTEPATRIVLAAPDGTLALVPAQCTFAGAANPAYRPEAAGVALAPPQPAPAGGCITDVATFRGALAAACKEASHRDVFAEARPHLDDWKAHREINELVAALKLQFPRAQANELARTTATAIARLSGREAEVLARVSSRGPFATPVPQEVCGPWDWAGFARAAGPALRVRCARPPSAPPTDGEAAQRAMATPDAVAGRAPAVSPPSARSEEGGVTPPDAEGLGAGEYGDPGTTVADLGALAVLPIEVWPASGFATEPYWSAGITRSKQWRAPTGARLSPTTTEAARNAYGTGMYPVAPAYDQSSSFPSVTAPPPAPIASGSPYEPTAPEDDNADFE